MKNILITGGLGYVGGRLAKRMAEEFNITVSSRKATDKGLLGMHGNIALVNHQQLFTKEHFPQNIHTVIHLAALNEHDCVLHPSEAIRVNIDETRMILENSIASGAANFIYFSTAHVYGVPLAGHIHESTVTRPVHPYAITHCTAEDYVIAARDKKVINGIVVRLSNSFGPPVLPQVNRWTLLVNDLCKQAVVNHQLKLLSNGCQYRDFITLADVAEAVVHFTRLPLSKTGNGLFNLGSGASMRVMDMAQLISDEYEKIYGKVIPILLPDAAVATDEPVLDFDITKLCATGFLPANNFSSEINEMLQFCSAHFASNIPV